MAVRKASFKVDVSELTRYRRGVARKRKRYHKNKRHKHVTKRLFENREL